MLQALDEPHDLEADYAACRERIRQGSRSFFAASLLLPERVRKPACAIYAFCRLSDDAVDDADAQTDAVDRLRERLDRAYEGRPFPVAADRAFADVMRRFAIPKTLPSALLDGLAFDAAGGRCRTLSDLQAYAARVAASVGAMMTVLMGVRDAATLARACDLGVAMQLTNIARDVGEDARNGRLYLPLDWMEEVGLDPERWLENPVFDTRIAGLVDRLLRHADALYARAASGVLGLPLACRPAIHAASLIYREIGLDVRRAGHDSISRRAVVSDRRKLGLVAKAVVASLAAGRVGTAPALPETQFLVAAVPRPASPERLASRFDDRVGWVIDLFGRLEQRDRYGLPNAPARNLRRD